MENNSLLNNLSQYLFGIVMQICLIQILIKNLYWNGFLQGELKMMKKKYKQNDINLIKRSLVYFDDVTENNWLAEKLLHDELPIQKIKQQIIDEVNNYNENIMGSI